MTVLFEKKEGVAYLTINRPEVLNALDVQTLKGLWTAWVECGDDPDVRVILITGRGDQAFSVGRDLKKYTDGEGVPRINDIFELFQEYTLGHAVRVDKPIIAAVNGYALGWGFTIVLLSDIRIASEKATFGFPEVTHGVPTGVGSLLLPLSTSWCHAMELLLTGKRISAKEALDMNLINRITPPNSLMPEAERIALLLAANAPLAVRATKRVARMGREMPFESARQMVEMLRFIVKQSDDAQEGPRAFAERRKPCFQGV